MKKIYSLLLVILIFFTFVSCNKNSQKPNEKKVIKIGAILPLTGNTASYGNEIKQGIEIAIKTVKSDSIEVFFEDSKSNPKDALNGLYKLIDDENIKVIIGEVSSSNTLSIAPKANEKKVILISPASSSPLITNAGDYIFRNYPSDNFEGKQLVKFTVDSGYNGYHVITINNEYGIGLKRVFEESLNNLGIKSLSIQEFEENNLDFRTILQNTKDLNEKNQNKKIAYLIVGYGKDLGLIIRQAREMGIRNQFFSTVNFLDENTVATGGSAIEGTIFTSVAFDPQSNIKEISEFVKNYSSQFKKSPSVWSAHGYDALLILYNAMKNSVDVEIIKQNLYNTQNYPGISGPTSFDKNGDVIKPLQFMTVKSGRFVAYDHE